MMESELNQRLTAAIGVFLTLLRTCWEPMVVLEKQIDGLGTNEFVMDWAQANWERIVEASVCVDEMRFIATYGEGADCHPQSSRVWEPGAHATHEVYCVAREDGCVTDALSGELIHVPARGMAFERFVTDPLDGSYLERPPFDYVLARAEGRDVVVQLHAVRFLLQQI